MSTILENWRSEMGNLICYESCCYDLEAEPDDTSRDQHHHMADFISGLLAAQAEELKAKHTVELEQLLVKVNNILYDEAPMGDINAWDAIKAFQRAQTHIEQLKTQRLTGSTGEGEQ